MQMDSEKSLHSRMDSDKLTCNGIRRLPVKGELVHMQTARENLQNELCYAVFVELLSVIQYLLARTCFVCLVWQLLHSTVAVHFF